MGKTKKKKIQIGLKFLITHIWSGSTNSLLNLIHYQPHLNEIELYTKGSFEAK